MEYRDFINTNMNDVITALNGSITPAPVNSELYRDFLNRKADDVITALNGSITPAPAGDELYRDFIERKFDDVIAGIGGYVPPVTFPTLTGSIVIFNSQYAGLPLKSHKIAITATQSGSGTPSPDNVRTINGYSAINISHSDADTSNPTVYTIQIGSTVYGGEYDARTGVLTVTHKYFSFDYTSNWKTDVRLGLRNFYIACPSDIKSRQYAGVSSMLCSVSPISTILNAQKDNCFISNIREFNYTWGDTLKISTAQGFKDYLQANNIVIEVVAELATHITIQLPPCPIDTLEGVNNIWADTGDTTLQYIKIGGNT